MADLTCFAEPSGPGVDTELEKCSLRYQLNLGAFEPGKHRETRLWWSHVLYLDPEDQPVQVSYSKTMAESEALAQTFLGEKILGFDMEWVYKPDDPDWQPSRLQEKVSCIQMASEDKIAVFHIGLHVGDTAEELIAPTLRRIIEDPDITKAGINTLNADFMRLKMHFGLNPRSAFELSHLHNLLAPRTNQWGRKLPATTVVRSLANLVQDYFDLPLWKKEDVRCGDWSQPLDTQQKNYAANDAYASLMLYHRMNAKRLKLDPVPPLPLFAELYQPWRFGLPPIRALLLRPGFEWEDHISITEWQAWKYYKAEQETRLKHPSGEYIGEVEDVRREDYPKRLDLPARIIYEELSAHRMELAKSQGYGYEVCRVALHVQLEKLAKQRPADLETLTAIKGIGIEKKARYGKAWIKVIKDTVSEWGLPPLPPQPVTELPTATSPKPKPKASLKRKAMEEAAALAAKRKMGRMPLADISSGMGALRNTWRGHGEMRIKPASVTSKKERVVIELDP